MAVSCNCSSCSRNDCNYCYSCREKNGDVCLFRKCRRLAYACDSQAKWQYEARRLANEYPQLESLYHEAFVANDAPSVRTENAMAPGENLQRFKHETPPLKTHYGDETSVNSKSAATATEPSFPTALPAFFSDLHEDEYHQTRPNRSKCGECSHCQRGVCNVCCFCCKRATSTNRRKRCPFLTCEAVSYSISFIKNLKNNALQSARINPETLGSLFESLYGENGFMTLQQKQREKERNTYFLSMYGGDDSAPTGQRTVMLRSKFKSTPSSVIIKEEESHISYKMVPVRPLRKRDLSAINPSEVSVPDKTPSIKKTRQIRCNTCEGCRRPACGRCTRCTKSLSCVFWLCDNCNYAPLYKRKRTRYVVSSLKLTMAKSGQSPLQELADTVMAGPLSTIHVSKGCDKSLVLKDEPVTKKRKIPVGKAKRHNACRECDGCTIAECGLCIHCKGMGRDGRSRCVFRVCHRFEYAPRSMARMASLIRQSLQLTRRRDGTSPLDSIAKTVMEGPLSSCAKKIVDLTQSEETSLLSEVAESDTSNDSDEESSRLSESDRRLYHASKRCFGLLAPGYSLLKGLDWNDDVDDWKEFICSLKMLSNADRETAIYFQYRQANELPVGSKRDHLETQKLERALVASIFLRAGLQSSPNKTVLHNARHSVLLYSLHFEDDRRLMTMLTSNMSYQMDLKQILKHPKMHELEPREFARIIRAL